ncbi:MAG: hypothetical protein QOF50_1555, partial [Gaiellaceae bacterium]|nr:hypothetical protein [Gaiellaceae bacterium]
LKVYFPIKSGIVLDRHVVDVPPLRTLAPGHTVACHWAEQIKAGEIQPKEREAVFEPGPQEPAYEPPPV